MPSGTHPVTSRYQNLLWINGVWCLEDLLVGVFILHYAISCKVLEYLLSTSNNIETTQTDQYADQLH